MSVRLPFDTQTITVIRPRKVVRNGSVYEDWDNPQKHDIENVEIQGWLSEEDHENADGVTTDYRVWAPIDSDLHSQDRVEFTYAGRDFKDYQVNGEPRLIADPVLGHMKARLSKREG